ncbi:hypothetical protein [Methanothermobacter sp.]|uniref:hypothetical protein n=1 Tax=Methanothermobacter sp. TaxID=1884223 RepID=UPI003C76D6F8
MLGKTHTFNYSVTYGPYNVPGLYTEANEASFVTCDTAPVIRLMAVDVYVRSPCGTLTVGYWNTHAGFNGNNGDAVTSPLAPFYVLELPVEMAVYLSPPQNRL